MNKIKPELPLQLLIEPETLHQTLQTDNSLLIVDLSKSSVYQQAHIPGAVHLEPKSLISGQQPAPGKLPSAEALSDLFSAIGLTEHSHVIAYDDEGGGWAGRFIWTLDMIGHKHYSYLNGGIHAWLSAGLPTEQTPAQPIPSNYKAIIQDGPSADKEYIQAKLGQPGFTIWDARSPAEYKGKQAFAQRAGHIPGAINFEWTEGMDKARDLKIKDPAELINTLSKLGINADDEIVTHCQTHHRSGFTYLLGKILGFKNIKAYPGSWSEWGNDQNTPIEID